MRGRHFMGFDGVVQMVEYCARTRPLLRASERAGFFDNASIRVETKVIKLWTKELKRPTVH